MTLFAALNSSNDLYFFASSKLPSENTILPAMSFFAVGGGGLRRSQATSAAAMARTARALEVVMGADPSRPNYQRASAEPHVMPEPNAVISMTSPCLIFPARTASLSPSGTEPADVLP